MLYTNEWVARYGDYLYSLAMLKTNTKVVAQDLVQDTFLSALTAKDSFRGESTEKTWLVAILNRKIIDYYRKKDVLKNTDDYLIATENSFQESFFQADSYSTAHWKSSARPSTWKVEADDTLHQEEFHKILQACIGKMPPRMIPIFVSKYVEEEESEKICKDYDISTSNFWVIVHRAKLLMRSCLEKNWFTTDNNPKWMPNPK